MYTVSLLKLIIIGEIYIRHRLSIDNFTIAHGRCLTLFSALFHISQWKQSPSAI